MAQTILKRKYLPAFIYVVDEIIREDIEPDYRDISECGVFGDQEVDERSIKRAFELREELRKNQLERRVYKPTQKTLNALTYYQFEEKSLTFLKMARRYRDHIAAHYKEHAPPETVLMEVFPKRPQKIQHLQTQEQTYHKYTVELKVASLEDFVKGMDQQLMERFNNLQRHMDVLTVKASLLEHLELKALDIQKQLKQAHFMYNTLGAFGLFWVSIDYDTVDKASILEDFLDDYEGLVDDDFLDDFI